MKTLSLYIILVAVAFMIAGCINGTYQWEEENRSNETTATVSLSNHHSGYLPRHDLGYPRLEYFLESYEQTIKRYANRYGFDWRFILAVMNQESRFRHQAVSSRGAYGLMQIMPATGRDISAKLFIDNVKQPENNIAGGVYYLWWVYTMINFDDGELSYDVSEMDRLQLVLAAYNGGPSRVRDAQQLARYLNLDPYRWVNIKSLLPMLSSRYDTLHQYVWENGIPSGGYFNGYPETLNYVDRVMIYYSYYQDMFE